MEEYKDIIYSRPSYLKSGSDGPPQSSISKQKWKHRHSKRHCKDDYNNLKSSKLSKNNSEFMSKWKWDEEEQSMYWRHQCHCRSQECAQKIIRRLVTKGKVGAHSTEILTWSTPWLIPFRTPWTISGTVSLINLLGKKRIWMEASPFWTKPLRVSMNWLGSIRFNRFPYSVFVSLDSGVWHKWEKRRSSPYGCCTYS